MDEQTTTRQADTRGAQPTSTPGSSGNGGAAVQLRQSLRGMDYDSQATQLKPADTGVQMMLKPGAALVQREATEGSDAQRPVQRRAVQRIETTPTPTTTPAPGNQNPAPQVQPDVWDQPGVTQWRQTFEVQIGNSLVGEATGVATQMAGKVKEYMLQRHGALDPAAKDYRAKVQAIGAALGKPDLDAKNTVWGGGVRPEDIEALFTEVTTDKTTSFGLRERLFACQMWYENAVTPDLVQSHEQVRLWATSAGMAVGKIDAFWANAVTKFAEVKNLPDPAANGANGAPIQAPNGMNAWGDVASMGTDPRLVEQGATRDPIKQDGTKARSDMTVAKFRELGGVLSNYELTKLIRLEGREAEFKALIDGGMDPEQALRQMVATGLDNAVLPWNEGAKTFKPKVDALVSQEAPNLPQMAGTSGTTARMMEVGGMLGVAPSTMLKTMLAMLLPIRAHSFQEVVRGSGLPHDFRGTVDDYTSVVAGCNSLDQAGFDKAKRSEAALAGGGNTQANTTGNTGGNP